VNGKTGWTFVWAALVSAMVGAVTVLLTHGLLMTRIAAILTVLALGVCAIVLLMRKIAPLVFWNEEMAVLLLIRAWRIEAQSARLLRSVPLGIDLSHSGKKVLQAMSEQLGTKRGRRLDFVVHRPVDDNPTCAGFVTSRSSFAGFSSRKRIEELSEAVFQDATVLESAMQASYPHTPIDRAGLQDLQMILTGGTAIAK
jgi:hypothetical protein